MLGLLFLWAAVSKLANPTEFLGSIYAYQLPLPKSFLQFMAVVLPWVELLCGLMLVANIWTESALACVSGLMVLFVLATSQAWGRDLNISCGCFDLKIFGLDKSFPNLSKTIESVGFAFFRNVVLTTLTIFLFNRRCAELNAPPTPEPQPQKSSGKPSMKHSKRSESARA